MAQQQQQQRSHVPKFGNWESEDNVPYTVYFEKARQDRNTGKIINPNDPAENPDLLSVYGGAPAQSSPSRPKAEPEEPIGHGHGVARRTHERQKSREGNDLKRFIDSPARYDNVNRRASNDSNHQRPGGRGAASAEGYRRPVRPSVGSDSSIERSPLHHQARVSGRGSGAPSPAWEGKHSHDSSHGTPGRSRMRPDSPDKGAAVPKFGEWDENNPASGDGYTHIFNQVRQERIAGGAGTGLSTGASYGNGQRSTAARDSSKCCCFPWGGN